MAIVQIKSKKKYTEAIGLLIRMGGFFWSKPDRKLQIGYGHLQALRAAGLVPEDDKAKRARNTPQIEPDGVAEQLFYLLPDDLKKRFKKRCLKLGITMKTALISIMEEFCNRSASSRDC